MQPLALGAGLDVIDLRPSATTLLENAAQGKRTDPQWLERTLAMAEHVDRAAGLSWLAWQWKSYDQHPYTSAA